MRSILRVVLFCFCLLLPLNVAAQLPAQIEDDFKPLSGYIIMPIGDEYLVDLDASANLREGDILTIVTPGEKVIHPVSKEILGTLDTPVGQLQVTRIKSGYSYAKLLSAENPPQKGNQVRRFEQVPALFVDETGNGESIRQDLTTGLPHIKWLSSGTTEKPLLLFTLSDNRLSVKLNSGTELYSYALVDGQLVAGARRPVSHSGFEVAPKSNKKLLQKVADSVLGTFSSSSKSDMGLGTEMLHQAGQTRAGVWMSPNLSGNPVGIVVGDFTGDGQLETAIAISDKLIISRITGDEYKQIAELKIPKNLSLLSLESADLDLNGTKELYLSASSEKKLSSLAIEYRNGSFQITIDKINWFLRSVEFPDQGTLLIGQKTAGIEAPFFEKPFQISRNGDELIAGETLPLPHNVNLYEFLPFQDTKGTLLYAYLSESDYLHVLTSGGLPLWESGDYFGGSESYYDPKPQTGTDEILPRNYITTRMLPGPSGEILVAQNDGIRTLQRFRMYKESRLIALTWNGFAMNENWRTAEQKGYLADFSIADANNDGKKEIAMAIKYKHKSLLDNARSAIVIYQLN